MLGWLDNLVLDVDITTIVPDLTLCGRGIRGCRISNDSCFDPEAPINHEIFKLLRWTLQAVNTYFRVLYRGGLFLPRSEAVTAVECGWKMLDPWMVYVHAT